MSKTLPDANSSWRGLANRRRIYIGLHEQVLQEPLCVAVSIREPYTDGVLSGTRTSFVLKVAKADYLFTMLPDEKQSLPAWLELNVLDDIFQHLVELPMFIHPSGFQAALGSLVYQFLLRVGDSVLYHYWWRIVKADYPDFFPKLDSEQVSFVNQLCVLTPPALSTVLNHVEISRRDAALVIIGGLRSFFESERDAMFEKVSFLFDICLKRLSARRISETKLVFLKNISHLFNGKFRFNDV